jgi:hypothetical protein
MRNQNKKKLVLFGRTKPESTAREGGEREGGRESRVGYKKPWAAALIPPTPSGCGPPPEAGSGRMCGSR